MEHLEIVDPIANQPMGVKPRAEVIANGHWCRSTNVFVFNSEGQILCHQRSLTKERNPGAWSTHMGGHVGVGESYESNAIKELEEEAGITVDPNHVISWRTTRIPSANLWVREFVTIIDKPADHFTPQPGEVERFEWKHMYEVLAAMKQQPDMWLAGTHDLLTEYQCMRAVLAATGSLGLVPGAKALHTWHPPQFAAA